MKNFYKGDIVIRKAGNEMKWAVTAGEMFFVACLVKEVGDDYILVHRPLKNEIKNFFYILTHIRLAVK